MFRGQSPMLIFESFAYLIMFLWCVKSLLGETTTINFELDPLPTWIAGLVFIIMFTNGFLLMGRGVKKLFGKKEEEEIG